MFDKIRGVFRIADETLCPAFDISSQSKQKPRSKRRYKIKIKVYANTTGFANIIHGWDFLSSNLMNNFITAILSQNNLMNLITMTVCFTLILNS